MSCSASTSWRRSKRSPASLDHPGGTRCNDAEREDQQGPATPERERPEESARARHAHSNELSHHEHEDELLRPNLIRTPAKLGLDAVVLVVATVLGLTASSLLLPRLASA